PPHQRPHLKFLHRIGLRGSDEEILAAASKSDQGALLRQCSSASAMWTANAATVVPSCDTRDSKVHFVPANLVTMLHRSLEPELTKKILSRIFNNPTHFTIHDPLPPHSHFSDEGSANHT